MFKKFIVYVSIILITLLNIFSGVQALNLVNLLNGKVSSDNFIGLQKSEYPLKRDYTFGNGLFLALPAGFGKVDIYLVKSYDGLNQKWIVQYLTSVDGEEVYKLGDRFNSLSFYTTYGSKKIIYTFYNTGASGWQILKVGTITDSNAIPMEFKDNIIILKNREVLKKVEVCAGETSCAIYQENNPDVIDSDNFVCDTTSIYADRNPTCYVTYQGDAVYAYSIKQFGTEFNISDVVGAKYEGVSYDGRYNWNNYSDHYDINNPIKINGLFLYNIDWIGSIKYYNIFTNVNWYLGQDDNGQAKYGDQIVMSTIKVYPDAQLSLDELGTGDVVVFSGDLANYRVFKY